ncbi:hypothetical protein TcG_07767 [Trypanosoma cruzi]|uniref:Uncharacterized protein n=1 Tax=Trypanosoma cruzi TaxID=5693 RepID=A0A2V2VA30_TRYCR|nr:hypothetical protein TcBrA4_0054590 [Trypanosoma cruzi]PBJ69289.1 hypothetical protein BCY84_20017 [Trypanosoma cruzi cruzi]PWU85104.1 hypothetical protein C4B63_183g99c [Trypanosoma cruzi]PWU92386.1 hypothetical protein C4B63_38g587c [Trypanosoma cruzi]RNF14471.1 hypothetical protein TcG_07767 [Trypanosoma cruzi]
MPDFPPLSEEEKKARERRLQAEHDRYVKSIATMRSLPRLQSTIAGAGGKTNEHARLAEERETERRQRHQAEADRLLERKEREKAHQAKVEALNARQQKKRVKAAKKKAKKARPRLEEGTRKSFTPTEDEEDERENDDSMKVEDGKD